MARYVIPPKQKYGDVIVKCLRCHAMYVPDFHKKSLMNATYYEPCPWCGYDHNDKGNIIPLWKYNLIKWWRGGFDKDYQEFKAEEDGDSDGQ